MVKSFRDLEVWRLCLDLAESVYRCTTAFPKNEVFGLVSQMRRAAVSIPSNVAEGQARTSSKEFLHFISVALGSLAELETQFELAVRLNYAQSEMCEATVQAEKLGKMLHGLQRSIRSRMAQPSR